MKGIAMDTADLQLAFTYEILKQLPLSEKTLLS